MGWVTKHGGTFGAFYGVNYHLIDEKLDMDLQRILGYLAKHSDKLKHLIIEQCKRAYAGEIC